MSDTSKAVFLSYASQDSAAVKRICEALRATGVEVWFDQNELRGGDAWDAKIRRQIQSCALFMPVISATTQARGEGYFRLEWKLAVDRSHLMADDAPFLLPVVIDDTPDATARVPDKFREVQWTRLRLDETPAQLADRVANLLTGEKKLEEKNYRDRERGESKRRHDRPAWVRHAWAAVGVLFAVVYGLRPFWSKGRTETELPSEDRTAQTPVPPSKVDPKSVAVLAFVDLSEDENPEGFSEGVSGTLQNALAKIPGLKVPAQTVALRSKGKNTSLTQIAQQLGVAYLIEGSVRNSGGKIRITAQLVNGADGLQLWSGNFTREAKDILSAEDEMAETVVAQVKALFVRTDGGVTSQSTSSEAKPVGAAK